MTEPENTGKIRDELGRFNPGISGNPAGRPKGSFSIKDAVRKHLEDNPDDFKNFVEYFAKKNRELSWQMLEGRPPQKIEHEGAVPVEDSEKIKKLTESLNKLQSDEIHEGRSISSDGASADFVG